MSAETTAGKGGGDLALLAKAGIELVVLRGDG